MKMILLLLMLFSVNVSATEITVATAASGDDANEEPNGTAWSTVNTAPYFGRWNAVTMKQIIRFTNVTIAQGNNIDSCHMYLRCINTDSDALDITFWAEDTASGTQGASEADYDAKFKTTASVNISTWSNWTTNMWYPMGDSSTPTDLKSIIQEVVNRSDWSSGNDITIMFEDQRGGGSPLVRQYRTHDVGGGIYAPYLIIGHSAGGGGSDPSMRRRKIILGCLDEQDME